MGKLRLFSLITSSSRPGEPPGWLLARGLTRPDYAIAAGFGYAIVTALHLSLLEISEVNAGVLIFPTLGQSLLPNFKENDLITYWATKPGTSLEETMRISNKGCRDYLREIPAVEKCSSHAGQALLGDEPGHPGVRRGGLSDRRRAGRDRDRDEARVCLHEGVVAG